MNTPKADTWINLQTYFKLGFLGTNFLILAISFSIALLLTTFAHPFTFSLTLSYYSIFYALMGLILCNQFISIFFRNAIVKKKTPSLSQLFLHKKKEGVVQLFICCLGLMYPFYFLEPFEYFTLLYTLFFLLFCPAIICCLINSNLINLFNPIPVFSFIFKDLFAYLYYMITLVLMGVGYKTIHYYATIWLQPEYVSLANICLLAYLFLVSAYVLSDSTTLRSSETSKADAQDLFVLKNYIALGNYDNIHAFFKARRLHTYSEDLLDFYLKFILALQDEEKISTFGSQRLFILFQSNHMEKAVSVYELIFIKHPSFQLFDPLFNYTLAKKFILRQQFRITTHLLSAIAKQNPNFRHLPEVLLMLAQAYVELNKDEMANQSLEDIIHNFPNSPYYSEAIALQKIIKINSFDQKPPLPK